jgi:hypothetical protein
MTICCLACQQAKSARALREVSLNLDIEVAFCARPIRSSEPPALCTIELPE